MMLMLSPELGLSKLNILFLCLISNCVCMCVCMCVHVFAINGYKHVKVTHTQHELAHIHYVHKHSMWRTIISYNIDWISLLFNKPHNHQKQFKYRNIVPIKNETICIWVDSVIFVNVFYQTVQTTELPLVWMFGIWTKVACYLQKSIC